MGWIGVSVVVGEGGGGRDWCFVAKIMKLETNMWWASGWVGVGSRPSVDVKGAAGLYFHRANSPWDNNGVQHHFSAADGLQRKEGRWKRLEELVV